MKRTTALLLSILVGISAMAAGLPDSRAAENEPEWTKKVWSRTERENLAGELGLTEYLDEDGYLDPEYHDGRSDKELEEQGIAPLVRNREHEKRADGTADNSGISMLSARTGGMMFTASELVSYMNTVSSYLEVDGIEAFCAAHGAPRPYAGDYTSSDPVLVTDQTQRKVLYYGWHGPAQWSGLTGYAQGRTVTSLALSYFYSGSDSLNWSIDGNYSTTMGLKGFKDYILSAANPPDDFLVYKVETDGGAKQDVMYWQYSPKGYLTLKKTSGDSAVTSGNSYYSLAGAEYGVYSDRSLSGASRVGTLTTDETGQANVLAVTPGTYYVYELKAPAGYVKDPDVHEVTVGAGHTASAPNSLAVTDTPVTVTIRICKVSGNEDATKDNRNYSLEGAEYSVYRDEACTIYAGKIVTDESGQGSLTGLALDEYWVKETKASSGFQRDPDVHKVDASSGSTAVIEKEVTSAEPPLLAPVSVLLEKADAETGGAAQGTGTLEGARFRVRFYDVVMDTDPAAGGYEALREWVFETDEEGVLYYSENSLISGDALYRDSEGKPALPYGTVTFEETAAPQGYLLNPEIITVPVTEVPGVGEIVYQETEQKENSLDLDLVKTQAGKNAPIAGVVFEHTRPDGSTEQYTTDEDGRISIRGLQWGDHVLREVETADGLALNTNEITFTVDRDNTITVTSEAEETDTDGRITVTVGDDGCLDVSVENKPAPFSLQIHKINNREHVLEHAEFTLYSDEACQKEVMSGRTDAEGNLVLKGLIPGKVYYLKETEAPAGYRLPVDPEGKEVVYEIRAESDVAEGTFLFYVNGKAYSGEDGPYYISGTPAERTANMTVINETGSRLPETGSNRTLILVVTGAVLMGAAIIFTLVSRKRKKDEE